MSKANVSLALAIADFGSEEAFRAAWKQGDCAVLGRRSAATSAMEKIPAAACDHAKLAPKDSVVIVQTAKRAPNASKPLLHTEESITDMIFGGGFERERWFDVQVRAARSKRPAMKPQPSRAEVKQFVQQRVEESRTAGKTIGRDALEREARDRFGSGLRNWVWPYYAMATGNRRPGKPPKLANSNVS